LHSVLSLSLYSNMFGTDPSRLCSPLVCTCKCKERTWVLELHIFLMYFCDFIFFIHVHVHIFQIKNLLIKQASCLEKLMHIMYLEGAQFESQIGHQLSQLNAFVGFLSSFQQRLEQYLVLGHGCIVPHPFQFIIH
jgi:hypothetical protein